MPNKKSAPTKVSKPAAKQVKKTALKPAVKLVKKAVSKPAPKPTKNKTVKTPVKPVKKAVVKSVKKAVVKTVKKVVVKPVKKAVVKTVKKAGSKPAKKVEIKVVKKEAPKPIAKPLKKILVKPTIKPTPKKALPVTSIKKVQHSKPEVKHVPEIKATVGVVSKPAPKKIEKHEPLKEVKIPKIHAKSAVPYAPDYKPMGQRVEAKKENAPLIRYNDSELNEFRDLINKKLDAAKRELNYLQGLITHKDDMGGDESENRYMTMEDGSISMEREQFSQMASRQITYIDHLEKALIRIENKTYGICRMTGKLIDKARLRAVPHATLSLDAKLGLVKPNQE